MVCTSTEAKNKICPYVSEKLHVWEKCQGESCMAWEWIDNIGKYGICCETMDVKKIISLSQDGSIGMFELTKEQRNEDFSVDGR